MDAIRPKRPTAPSVGQRRRLSVASAVAALALGVMVGCQGQSLRGPGLSDSSDLRRDLTNQLSQVEQRFDQAKAELDQSLAQVGQLEKQLAGQKDVQSLLQQRVDNLLSENQQLHQELTAVVMNAVEDGGTSSILQNVSGSVRAPLEIPDGVVRSLQTLTDHRPGLSIEPSENVIRIASSQLFSQGDEFRPSSREMLQELATILNSPEARRFNFLVVAHAPPGASVPKELVPLHPTTWHLTAHQAIAVEQFLEEAGLAPTRVGIVSYAGQQPLVGGEDEASRRTNARVEIFFTPPDPKAE